MLKKKIVMTTSMLDYRSQRSPGGKFGYSLLHPRPNARLRHTCQWLKSFLSHQSTCFGQQLRADGRKIFT